MRDCPPALDTATANAAKLFGLLPTLRGASFRSGHGGPSRAIERDGPAQRNRNHHAPLTRSGVHFPRRRLQKEAEPPVPSDVRVVVPEKSSNLGWGIGPQRSHRSGGRVVRYTVPRSTRHQLSQRI